MEMGEDIRKKVDEVSGKILKILDRMDRWSMFGGEKIKPREFEELLKLQQEFNELMRPFNDRLWP